MKVKQVYKILVPRRSITIHFEQNKNQIFVDISILQAIKLRNKLNRLLDNPFLDKKINKGE